MNIILIGFMTSGKTTVGKKLADRLSFGYCDIDARIEQSAGLSIPDIFTQRGEDYFRKLESNQLKKLQKETNLVIATGGGIVINSKNRALLKKIGTVVYLRVTPEDVLERVGDYRTRPLLNHDDPKKRRQVVDELLAKREPWYVESADLVLDSHTGHPEQNVEDIVQYLHDHP
jgi:shikimate kinase